MLYQIYPTAFIVLLPNFYIISNQLLSPFLNFTRENDEGPGAYVKVPYYFVYMCHFKIFTSVSFSKKKFQTFLDRSDPKHR